MPRVHHVKSARKADKSNNIKVGDEYYWWAFRLGRSSRKVKSKTPPKRSQLTMSEYYGTLYALQENTNFHSAGSSSELESMRDDLVGELESLRDEQEEKRSNMPEGLQDSNSGELLQERYDELDGVIDELNGVDIPDGVNDDDDKKSEEKDDNLSNAADELDGILNGI